MEADRSRAALGGPWAEAALAAVASGALIFWAQPAQGGGPVAWVALVPAAVVALRWRDTLPGRIAVPAAFGLGLLAMLAAALPPGVAEGQWARPPVDILVADTPIFVIGLLGIPLVVGLLTLVGFGSPGPWPGRLGTVAWPALGWVVLDFLRTGLDPAGMWATLYLTQSGTPAAGLAAVGGPWLITLAVAAVNYALADALTRRSPGRAFAAAGIAGTSLLAGLLAIPAVDRPGTTVAAVQPGYDTAERDRAPEALSRFRRGSYDLAALDLIGDLEPIAREAADAADLVVLPEAAFWADPREEGAIAHRLGALASLVSASVIAPAFDSEDRHNQAYVVDPEGEPRGPLPKHRPMWFLGERPTGLEPARPVRAGGMSVGALLGVDSQGPGPARRLARDGAEVLASATHDWRQLAGQHLEQVRLIAISTGRPVVRSDWRYASAVVGKDGRVRSLAADRERTAVLGPVAGPRETPYLTIGDAVAWAAVVLIASGALAAGVGGLSRRRGRPSR